MFERITTSLTRPPLTVFFMKDSWWRTILYIFLLPVILIIPVLITVFATDEMPVERYELMFSSIKSDLRLENAYITDGVLSYETGGSTSFDYFLIYVGDQERSYQTINFVFEDTDLVMYVSNLEIDRESYESLGLSSHDFSATNTESIREISVAIKNFIEKQSMVSIMDISLNYTIGLMDYLFISILMSMMTFLFVRKIQIPFVYRFKLSIYLSTIWVFSELVLTLFNLKYLNFINVILVYIYHIWAYRSMTIVIKEAK